MCGIEKKLFHKEYDMITENYSPQPKNRYHISLPNKKKIELIELTERGPVL